MLENHLSFNRIYIFKLGKIFQPAILVYRSVMTMTLVTLACRVHPPQILQSGVMPVCPLNKTPPKNRDLADLKF